MNENDEIFARSKHCRERIELINFAMGKKWMHWPTPSGNYRTNDKYEFCRGFRAEPEGVSA